MTDGLACEGISFGYGRGPAILTEWSQEFAPGQVTALTGASGRGKSTLLYLLGLMVRPRSGTIRLDGRLLTGLPDARRAHMRASTYGFVFQDAALDPTRTVLDNVLETTLYRREDRGARVRRARELLECMGVQVPADRRPGQVSGGQAQRIAVCRALLHRPHVLLADEPTGNLDAGSAGVVMAAMSDVAADGGVVVVATHDPQLMRHCDRVVSL
ncbi:ABC transporter ATP-binding protein [Xylanimonas sp. McL0601]|uniref:ABC transporter ATP-binding protein n=1 Tax=Xylanimonas sp. McL0601 TaxID=3414739 RepID=UPI003CFB7CA0